MNRKKSHVGKSQASREAYTRYIKKLDYESTVEEPTPFVSTTESGEELLTQTSNRKRRISLSDKFIEHFSENWIGWVICIAIAILYFTLIDSKVDLARINTNIENIKEDINSIKNDIKEQDKKNHDQDLSIKENSIRISNVEKRKKD